MKILFVDTRVNNPVRINVALPMTFLSLYSYVKSKIKNIDFSYHSLELDSIAGKNKSFNEIFNEHQPDIVLSTAVSSNFSGATDVLKFFKGKGCLTMIGGLFPSANDTWVLENFPFIDMVFKGEGEQSFADVLQDLCSGNDCKKVQGVSFRDGDRIIPAIDREVIPDINVLPEIEYDKLPVDIYKRNETRYYVFASRGCNFNCDFCTLTPHWKNKHRKFSIDRVLKEIEKLVTLFTPKQISFGDDTVSLDREYFVALCETLFRKNFPVHFGGKTRLDLITYEHLELMKRAGFKELSFGVESNDEQQLAMLNKRRVFSALGHLADILDYAEKLDMRINLNFILGIPGETPHTLKSKAEFIIRHCSRPNVVPLLGFFTPHRGTRLFDQIEEKCIKIIDHNYDHYNHLQPVCLPESLGEDGFNLLKEIYNHISKETSSILYNPILEKKHEP